MASDKEVADVVDYGTLALKIAHDLVMSSLEPPKNRLTQDELMDIADRIHSVRQAIMHGKPKR